MAFVFPCKRCDGFVRFFENEISQCKIAVTVADGTERVQM